MSRMTHKTWLSDLHQKSALTMLERDLQEAVRQLCQYLHLRYYHTHTSRFSPKGWPDCVIAHPSKPGALIFRELKREKQRPTPDQQAWLDILTAAGLDAGVWRPVDLLNGTILRELREVAG